MCPRFGHLYSNNYAAYTQQRQPKLRGCCMTLWGGMDCYGAPLKGVGALIAL